MSNSGTMVKTIQFNNNNTLPDLSKKHGAEITAAVFGLNTKVVKEVSNVNKMYRSKHGMFASVPILCQDTDCPYKAAQSYKMHSHSAEMPYSWAFQPLQGIPALTMGY